MKIAQLTFNVYDNYGNMLQKYALHRVLKRYADTVEVLWTNEDNFLPETWEWNWRQKLVEMFNSAEERRRFTFESIRQSKFKEFNDRYIRTRYDIKSLEDIADDYDYFVVGSDQVWNPEFSEEFFPGRFLSFAPKEKRIAYAASIAIPEIPEKFKKSMSDGISNMAHVSVREKSSVRIVENLTGAQPQVVVDPTFLLNSDEWREVAQKPAWLNDDYNNGYILTYFLGEPPLNVKTIAEEFNFRVINLFNIEIFNHYNVGPSEFLYLVENAALIYTNSFHGVAFSILTGRPFVFCDFLKIGPTLGRLSRVYSLLEDFKLTERKAIKNNNFRLTAPLEIDYSQRDLVLTKEREKAKQFLDKALGSVH